MYLAANISNPLFAPFLYGLELQIGTWLRSGQFLSAARLHEVRLQGLVIDLLVGSVVVGLALAVLGTLVTYRGSRARPEEAALVEAAAERYLPIGITAWEFARAKLRADPGVPAGSEGRASPLERDAARPGMWIGTDALADRHRRRRMAAESMAPIMAAAADGAAAARD